MALDKTFSSGEILSAANANAHLLSMWIPIDKRVITSGSAVQSVSWQSIDSNFRMFRITYYAHIVSSALRLRFNNDSGSNYFYQHQYTDSSTVTGSRVTSANAVDLQVGSAGNPAFGTIHIGKPTTSTTARFTCHETASAASTPWLLLSGGGWNNTSSLINRIDMYSDTGTLYGVFALEGMRGV